MKVIDFSNKYLLGVILVVNIQLFNLTTDAIDFNLSLSDDQIQNRSDKV